MFDSRKAITVAMLLMIAQSVSVASQDSQRIPAPDRGSQDEGPFERLIIRGATVIDGTGAPPRGPVDIVVERNRIVEIKSVGVPHVPIDESKRPQGATKELDASGMFVTPGFIDLHTHIGGFPKAPEAEYVYKLWMGHGVTTTRDAGSGASDFVLNEKNRSESNEIVAPRIFAYARPGAGDGWEDGPTLTPEKAREWVRWAANKGIDGLKLGSYDPEIMAALLDEAKKRKLGSMAHLGQDGVARMNVLDAARLGLGTQTHFYGLFEALLEDHYVQDWPVDQNQNDEQHRFGQVARLWDQIHPRGSEKWNGLIDELVELGLTIDPTMTIYAAGRVTTGSDSGFIYKLYGFAYIEEFELLQEAGFHPLEVIRSATLNGAETLHEPKGIPIEFGILRSGLLADLVVVEENPLQNFKVLYGTGTLRLDNETGEVERVGGVKYTIKDGIVYDAKELLADVARMVEQAKLEEMRPTEP